MSKTGEMIDIGELNELVTMKNAVFVSRCFF